ncbi:MULTISPECIES: hypothetical protein [Streptomyces]|uniref:hypothetical protein n=1 Tax=Streptomyces TaxID=1883 RepID=UPI00084C14D0|nr:MULTISPECIES: hypothetical protein [Streptomyces]TFI20801.1 hypothetical protein E4P36_35195 [Streptomyces sp. 4R-3d]
MASNSGQQDSGSRRDSRPEADTYNFADLVRSSGALDPQRQTADRSAPSRADVEALRRDMGVTEGTGPGYRFADSVRATMASLAPEPRQDAQAPTSGTGSGYRFADLVRASLPSIERANSGEASQPSGPAAGTRNTAPGKSSRKAGRQG